MSVHVAKCGENFHKLNQYTHSLSVTKNDLSWLNNLFMVMFQLMSMSSYDNNKLHLCSVTQHQCRHRQMWGKFSQIHPVHSLLSVTKMTCLVLNNLFMVRFQLIRMSSYAKNKLQMCSVPNISVDVAKCGESFTNSPSTLTFCLLQKMLSWLNNLFMVRS